MPVMAVSMFSMMCGGYLSCLTVVVCSSTVLVMDKDCKACDRLGSVSSFGSGTLL